MASISTQIQTRASKAWSQYMWEIVGLTSVILISSVMGFVASAMLLNAADTDSTSDTWDTAARWIGGINIVLFAAMLGFGIYIMYRAVRYEKSGRRVLAPRWKTQGGAVKPVSTVKPVTTAKPVAPVKPAPTVKPAAPAQSVTPAKSSSSSTTSVSAGSNEPTQGYDLFD